MGDRGQRMRRATGTRARWCDSGSLRPQTGATQQIVGEGMEQHDAAHLAAAPHQHLPKIALAHLREQAFQLRADPVHPLAERAAHQLAPDRHPGTVARPRGIGIFAIASLSRDHRGGVVGPGPFNVGELAKPAIGQIPGRRLAIAVLELLEHRTQLANVAAAGVDRDPDDHLTVGIARHLDIVGRPEAAVRHLHHPRLGIRGRGPHRLPVLRLALGLSHLTLDLEFAIYIGVLLSLMLFLNQAAHPGIRDVKPDPQTRGFNFDADTGLPDCPQLKMLRLNGSVFFGAADHVNQALQHVDHQTPTQKHLLIVASGINFVDVSGAEMLVREARRRKAMGGGPRSQLTLGAAPLRRLV